VLWRCWLGGRKGIRPVENWAVGCWRGYLSGARCRLKCIWSSGCHCHSLSLASGKSRLVLPFWYRLTRVVPDKGPLKGCVCVLTYLLTYWSTSPIHPMYTPPSVSARRGRIVQMPHRSAFIAIAFRHVAPCTAPASPALSRLCDELPITRDNS